LYLINEELLAPVIASLNTQGKKALVVIVDGLNRLENPSNP
jgi:hypothetical protein